MAQKTGAFTLVELLVVVSIISILAVLAIPSMSSSLIRTRVARVHNDMRVISMGLESYAVDHNRYPRHLRLLESTRFISKVPLDQFGTDEKILKQAWWLNDVGLTHLPIRYEQYLNADMIFRSGLLSVDDQLGTTIVQELRLHYLLGSVGPDHQWNNGYVPKILFLLETPDHFHLRAQPCLTMPYRDYDPTNGLVSHGNIFRTSVHPTLLGVHSVLYEDHYGEVETDQGWR